MLGIFAKSLLLGYSGAVVPGSLLAYTIDKSFKKGARAGLLISLGHSMLELIVILFLFLGAGKYLGTAAAKTAVGLLGGTVLIYLGISMIIGVFTGRVAIGTNGVSTVNRGNLIFGGALISASNPYFTVWWIAVGLGLMMNAYNSFGILGIAVFYIGHIIADITWYVFVSTLISKTRKFINLKVYKIIIVILGVCIMAFGTSFILVSISNIL